MYEYFFSILGMSQQKSSAKTNTVRENQDVRLRTPKGTLKRKTPGPDMHKWNDELAAKVNAHHVKIQKKRREEAGATEARVYIRGVPKEDRLYKVEARDSREAPKDDPYYLNQQISKMMGKERLKASRAFLRAMDRRRWPHEWLYDNFLKGMTWWIEYIITWMFARTMVVLSLGYLANTSFYKNLAYRYVPAQGGIDLFGIYKHQVIDATYSRFWGSSTRFPDPKPVARLVGRSLLQDTSSENLGSTNQTSFRSALRSAHYNRAVGTLPTVEQDQYEYDYSQGGSGKHDPNNDVILVIFANFICYWAKFVVVLTQSCIMIWWINIFVAYIQSKVQ